MELLNRLKIFIEERRYNKCLRVQRIIATKALNGGFTKNKIDLRELLLYFWIDGLYEKRREYSEPFLLAYANIATKQINDSLDIKENDTERVARFMNRLEFHDAFYREDTKTLTVKGLYYLIVVRPFNNPNQELLPIIATLKAFDAWQDLSYADMTDFIHRTIHAKHDISYQYFHKNIFKIVNSELKRTKKQRITKNED